MTVTRGDVAAALYRSDAAADFRLSTDGCNRLADAVMELLAETPPPPGGDDRAIEALTCLVAKLWHGKKPESLRPYSASGLDRWTVENLDDDMRAALNGSIGESFGDRLLPVDRRTGWDSEHPVSARIRSLPAAKGDSDVPDELCPDCEDCRAYFEDHGQTLASRVAAAGNGRSVWPEVAFHMRERHRGHSGQTSGAANSEAATDG